MKLSNFSYFWFFYIFKWSCPRGWCKTRFYLSGPPNIWLVATSLVLWVYWTHDKAENNRRINTPALSSKIDLRTLNKYSFKSTKTVNPKTPAINSWVNLLCFPHQKNVKWVAINILFYQEGCKKAAYLNWLRSTICKFSFLIRQKQGLP